MLNVVSHLPTLITRPYVRPSPHFRPTPVIIILGLAGRVSLTLPCRKKKVKMQLNMIPKTVRELFTKEFDNWQYGKACGLSLLTELQSYLIILN